MVANGASGETSLIDEAVAWLRDRVPASWSVERGQRPGPDAHDAAQNVDAFIDLRSPNSVYVTLAVEARAAFTPRDVELLLLGLARSLRALAGYVPLLVVAPWLSERTRQLLAREQINYLDLTGNALIRLENPAVFIESAGANRNPAPSGRGPASIRGDRAARLVRLLCDVRPPYGGRDLAAAAELTPGYVSRLLDSLDRDALVDRGHRGVVERVDVPALLRAWAREFDVFKLALTSTYVAVNGASDARDRLAKIASRICVTGSFAAVRLAAVAAPSMLAVYCEDVPGVAAQLGLLPADEGANVALLRPFDGVVWARSSEMDGVRYAAPSQVVVDCLSGNGRMPAEGEAVLAWMQADEQRWRLPSLATSAPIG